jgi:O-antigen biosynthesis protein
MNSANPTRLASIIIPCWNQRGFSQLCLQALFRHTRPAWELIIVDNGSNDGTADYLAGVRDTAAVPVTVISNARNVGFPAAINQGLQVAAGEYLVMLNNDAVVTDGWLDQLIALAEMRTTEGNGEPTTKDAKHTKKEVSTGGRLGIGLVGPMSNYAAPPQLVEGVALRRHGADAGVCAAVARRASGEMVYRAQAVRVLLADETSGV